MDDTPHRYLTRSTLRGLRSRGQEVEFVQLEVGSPRGSTSQPPTDSASSDDSSGGHHKGSNRPDRRTDLFSVETRCRVRPGRINGKRSNAALSKDKLLYAHTPRCRLRGQGRNTELIGAETITVWSTLDKDGLPVRIRRSACHISGFFKAMLEDQDVEPTGNAYEDGFHIAYSFQTLKVVKQFLENSEVVPMPSLPRPLPPQGLGFDDLLREKVPSEHARVVFGLKGPQLFDLLDASDFLQIDSLVELASCRMAWEWKRQSVEDLTSIRECFEDSDGRAGLNNRRRSYNCENIAGNNRRDEDWSDVSHEVEDSDYAPMEGISHQGSSRDVTAEIEELEQLRTSRETRRRTLDAFPTSLTDLGAMPDDIRLVAPGGTPVPMDWDD